MTATQLHHISFVPYLLCLGTALVLFFWGALKRQERFVRWACVAFGLAGLCMVPLYLSGHPTRQQMPAHTQVAELAIDKHYRMTKFALVGALVTGLAGAGTLLYFRRRPLPDWLVPNLFFLILMTVTFTARSWVSAVKIGAEMRAPPPASAAPTQPAS
jgi:hypothetical protein